MKYGKGYQPHDHSEAEAAVAWLFVLLTILCIGFCSCNSVKKTYSKSTSNYDSSSYSKIDSSVKKAETIISDSTGKKTWDTETVIEFENGTIKVLPINNDTSASIKSIKLADGDIGELTFTGVKKLTRKSNGADTSSQKRLYTKTDDAKKTEDKGKGATGESKTIVKGKETERSSVLIFIFLGAALIAGFLLFLFTRKKII